MRIVLAALVALATVAPAAAAPIVPSQVQFNAQILLHCGLITDGEYGAIIDALNDRILANPGAYPAASRRNVNAPVPSVASCQTIARRVRGY